MKIKFKSIKKYIAVLEIDDESDLCLAILGKINVGFDRCKISKSVHVMRCYGCGQFNHKSSECKNKQACSKCGDEHKTSECTSSSLK